MLGDEDSLVNLLLFGTSFTAQPRITADLLSRVEQELHAPASGRPGGDALSHVLANRISDLIAALAAPGKNERLQYMRHLLGRKGMTFESPAARKSVRQYLVKSVKRVLTEFDEYHKTIEAAHAAGDASAEFAVRSTLYQKRGISLGSYPKG